MLVLNPSILAIVFAASCTCSQVGSVRFRTAQTCELHVGQVSRLIQETPNGQDASQKKTNKQKNNNKKKRTVSREEATAEDDDVPAEPGEERDKEEEMKEVWHLDPSIRHQVAEEARTALGAKGPGWSVKFRKLDFVDALRKMFPLLCDEDADIKDERSCTPREDLKKFKTRAYEDARPLSACQLGDGKCRVVTVKRGKVIYTLREEGAQAYKYVMRTQDTEISNLGTSGLEWSFPATGCEESCQESADGQPCCEEYRVAVTTQLDRIAHIGVDMSQSELPLLLKALEFLAKPPENNTSDLSPADLFRDRRDSFYIVFASSVWPRAAQYFGRPFSQWDWSQRQLQALIMDGTPVLQTLARRQQSLQKTFA